MIKNVLNKEIKLLKNELNNNKKKTFEINNFLNITKKRIRN